MQERILIVDDDPLVLEILNAVLAREGFLVTQARSGLEGLEQLAGQPHALALCDIRMPGMDGFDFLGEIRRRHPELDVVLTTGYGSLEGAVDAMAMGAADYLTKPLKPKEIVARLRAILRRRQLEAEVHELQRELYLRHDIRNLIAVSPKMRALVTGVQRVAHSDRPVFLSGEAGTGRRFMARAIHYSGDRRDGSFGAVECDSPPTEGLETQLFGRRESGRRPRRGLLERLAGGTLHVHRLEASPPEVQRRLAEVVDTGAIPTGPDRQVPLETRLILSANGDLEDLLGSGRLVPELASLQRVTALHIPSLAERRQDLPGLVKVFCEQYAVDHGRTLEVSAEVLETLSEQRFEGNVGELFGLLKHAATMSLDGRVTPDTLQRALRQGPRAKPGGRPIAAALGEREYQLVLRAVQRNPGRLDEAARELGVSRTTLWRRMRKYGIRT